MTTAVMNVRMRRVAYNMRDRWRDTRRAFITAVWYTDMTALEIATSFLGVTVGLFLLLRGDVFGSSPGYRVMQQMMNERQWGAVLFSAGATGLIGRFTCNIPLRMLAALMLAMAWSFMAIALVRVNTHYTSTILYPSLTLLSVWCFARVAPERGHG